MPKKQKKTPAEIAAGLVTSLNETESVLNTFRNIGKYKYRKQVHLSDVELNAKLDEDTASFIRTRSEYETMFYFLENEGLTEKYARFRADVHKEIQKGIKEEEDESKNEN